MLKSLLDKNNIERRRGWLIKFLNTQYPSPIEVSLLQSLMDSVNFPMTNRTLARELDFLRSEKMLRVFPLCNETEDELSDVAQAKLLQRYAADSDDEEGRQICVRLRTQGINFQEGAIKCIGVQRII